MSEKEKKILETIATAVPKMSEFDKDLDKASQKIKEMTIDTFTILCIAAVHDEFGFGEKRCRRLIAKMEEGAEYLMDDLATWDDYIKEIKEQLNIDLRIRWNN